LSTPREPLAGVGGRGHTSKGKGGKGRERLGGEQRGREREGRKGRGIASSLFNFWLRACI